MARLMVGKIKSPEERKDAVKFLKKSAAQIKSGQTGKNTFTAALKYY